MIKSQLVMHLDFFYLDSYAESERDERSEKHPEQRALLVESRRYGLQWPLCLYTAFV